MLFTLIQNTALLLAMMVVFDLASDRNAAYGQWPRQVLAGVIIGGISLGLMIASFQLETGIIFDTRSVLLSLSGLFLGPIPTVFAMAIAAVYRASLGGTGMWTGILVMLGTGGTGILWRTYRPGRLEDISIRELYGFGMVVHLVMLALMLTLPWEAAQRVLGGISLPVLLVYPLATVALGWLLTKRLQRENTSASLTRSEHRFQQLFAAAPMPLVLSDREGTLSLVNHRWEQMFGYTHQEIPTTKDWWRLAYPDPDYRRWVINTWEAALRHAQESGNDVAQSSSFKVTCKNGYVKTLVITGTIIEESILIAFYDITERTAAEADQRRLFEKIERDRRALVSTLEDQRRTEKSLRKSEEELSISEKRYRSVIAVSNTGAWEFHHKEKYLWCSPEYFDMLGRNPDEYLMNGTSNLETSWSNLIHPDDRQSAADNFNAYLDSGSIGMYENIFRMSHADGSWVWIWSRGQTIRNPDGSVSDFTIGTHIDITERERLHEELAVLNAELELKVAQRTAQLEASNKELEAFSYSVSHDLRAPLRHISGYVDLLNKHFQEALPEKARHYLDEVKGSAQQMGVLIDDLLLFSRTSRQDLQQTEMDTNAAVQEVLDKLKLDTENRNISWTVADLPRVFGDPSLLKQVWANLLENAVKYTRYKDETIIEVGLNHEPGHWVFFVRDNGAGFDMQYAHKLFGVFQRLHSSTQFEGTGIGLASVQRIINKHGGRVWVEAQPDNGATFYFTLADESSAAGGTP